MDKQLAIDEMLQALEGGQAKPPVFLNAWKSGVYLAGARFFNVDCESVGQAVSVDQLKPNLEAVFQVIGSLSTYERVFILSMCQFYNDNDLKILCRESCLELPTLPDIASLDDERRKVIVALLNNYSGW